MTEEEEEKDKGQICTVQSSKLFLACYSFQRSFPSPGRAGEGSKGKEGEWMLAVKSSAQAEDWPFSFFIVGMRMASERRIDAEHS